MQEASQLPAPSRKGKERQAPQPAAFDFAEKIYAFQRKQTQCVPKSNSPHYYSSHSPHLASQGKKTSLIAHNHHHHPPPVHRSGRPPPADLTQPRFLIPTSSFIPNRTNRTSPDASKFLHLPPGICTSLPTLPCPPESFTTQTPILQEESSSPQNPTPCPTPVQAHTPLAPPCNQLFAPTNPLPSKVVALHPMPDSSTTRRTTLTSSPFSPDLPPDQL